MSAPQNNHEDCIVRLSRAAWREINDILSESKILDNYHPSTEREQRERENLVNSIDAIDRAIRHGSNF